PPGGRRDGAARQSGVRERLTCALILGEGLGREEVPSPRVIGYKESGDFPHDGSRLMVLIVLAFGSVPAAKTGAPACLEPPGAWSNLFRRFDVSTLHHPPGGSPLTRSRKSMRSAILARERRSRAGRGDGAAGSGSHAPRQLLRSSVRGVRPGAVRAVEE